MKRKTKPRRSGGQLDSVLDWLVENRRSRTWLAKRFGYQKDWASKFFRGDITCSMKLGGALSRLTGISLEQLERECLK